MNPRKIEQLDPATNLQDNDLMFASVLGADDTYVSKKVTLEDIANYVRNGMEPVPDGSGSESRFGGYETYDTSESGDGIYTTSAEVQEYCDNPSKNYLWDLLVGRGSWNATINPVVTGFEKTFHKDCAIYIWNLNSDPEGTPIITINKKTISTKSIAGILERYARFYVKSGQTLKIDFSQYGNISVPDTCCAFVTIIPLRSGGIFFDTNNNTGWQSGQASSMSGDFVFKNTEQCKVLFTTYGIPYFNSPRVPSPNATSNQPHTPKLNEKYTHLLDDGQGANIRWIILNPGDEFAPLSGALGGGGFWWNSYPLSESDSSGTSTCNCVGGAVIYDVDDENYIWEQNISETGFDRTFTKNTRMTITNVTKVQHFYIDEKEITIRDFIYLTAYGLPSYSVMIDIKAGQRVRIQAPADVCQIYCFPLSHGGVFIDTSKSDLFENQGEYIPQGGDSNWWTKQVDDFTMLNMTFSSHWVMGDNNSSGVHINGKRIFVSDGLAGGGVNWPNRRIYLKPGDEIKVYTSTTLKYSSYPILMDSSSSESEPNVIQLWENGPLWATKNIGAKRDIDFGEYFQYGSLNGYRYENNVFVGNDNDNFEFNTNNSLVYGKSREQLLQDGIITEDNVLTSNYDAATQKFGSEWRIPSYNDWIALNSYCDMQWTRKNGVEGVMITGRNAYADKSIFLPNSGHAQSDRPVDQIRYSSTKISYGPTTTQAGIRECAYFTNSGQSEQVLVDVICAVQDGLPIRPIKVVS